MKLPVFSAALLAIALPTAAAADDAPLRQAVAYDDLDLTKPADLRILDRRLAAAVVAVCPDARSAGQLLDAHSCQTRARSRLRPVRARVLAAAQRRSDRISTSLAAAQPSER